MNAPAHLQRLQFLVKIVQRESAHLLATNERLFAVPLTPERLRQFDTDPVLAERVDAFVARFGRLQDTLGDKLVPALLAALREPVRAAIDNLDCAERMGWIASADQWVEARQLRNQMIYEYVDDPILLAGNLQAGHRFVPTLVETVRRLVDEIAHRGWT